MQTPARPFTVGGPTLSQQKSAYQSTPTAAGDSQKKVVSFKTGVFPSPTAGRTTFTPPQQAVPGSQQQQYSTTSAYTSVVPSSVNSHATPNFTRSTDTSKLLPGSSLTNSGLPVSRLQQSTSSSGALGPTNVNSLDAMARRPDGSSSSSSLSSSSGQKRGASRLATSTVPVDPVKALEARKAVMAKRLRVNLVLLLAWYLVTDSRLYR